MVVYLVHYDEYFSEKGVFKKTLPLYRSAIYKKNTSGQDMK